MKIFEKLNMILPDPALKKATIKVLDDGNSIVDFDILGREHQKQMALFIGIPMIVTGLIAGYIDKQKH